MGHRFCLDVGLDSGLELRGGLLIAGWARSLAGLLKGGCVKGRLTRSSLEELGGQTSVFASAHVSKHNVQF